MFDRSLYREIRTVFVTGIPVIVDDVDGSRKCQHIDKRRHRHQNRVHGLARKPHVGQTRDRSRSSNEEQHDRNTETAKTQIGQRKSDRQRQSNQSKQRCGTFFIDGNVIAWRTANSKVVGRNSAFASRQLENSPASFAKNRASDCSGKLPNHWLIERDNQARLPRRCLEFQFVPKLVPQLELPVGGLVA